MKHHSDFQKLLVLLNARSKNICLLHRDLSIMEVLTVATRLQQYDVFEFYFSLENYFVSWMKCNGMSRSDMGLLYRLVQDICVLLLDILGRCRKSD